MAAARIPPTDRGGDSKRSTSETWGRLGFSWGAADEPNLVRRVVTVGLLLLPILSGLMLLRGDDHPLAGWDATADWLTTQAAWDDYDPYQPVADLGALFGRDVGTSPSVPESSPHPRLPGAFLLQAPLLALSADAAVILMQASNVVALCVLLGLLIHRMSGSHLFAVALISVPLSLPFVSSVNYGTQSGLLAVLLLGVMVSIKRHHQLAAGTLLGLAITLKLFPALLLLPLAAGRRWRAVFSAVTVFFILNVAAMGIMDISLPMVTDGLRGATQLWTGTEGNGSIAGMMAKHGVPVTIASVTGVCLGIVGAWTVARRRSIGEGLAWTIGASILASPLAWDHYQLLNLAAFRETSPWTKRRVGMVVALWAAWNVFLLGLLLSQPPANGVFQYLLVVGAAIVPTGLFIVGGPANAHD